MMSLIQKLFPTVLLLALVGTTASGASLTISMIRTTMPASQWNQFASATDTWEQTVAGYANEFSFTYQVAADADSLDFIYTFAEGWDYAFYDLWRNQVLAILNNNTPASAGYKWDIQVDGSVDPESNPLRDLWWMVDPDIIDGDYINAEGLGFFWAPGWNTEGGYYAYLFNALSWWYVYGNGYYFTEDGIVFNVPGTDWVYRFDGTGWTRLGG